MSIFLHTPARKKRKPGGVLDARSECTTDSVERTGCSGLAPSGAASILHSPGATGMRSGLSDRRVRARGRLPAQGLPLRAVGRFPGLLVPGLTFLVIAWGGGASGLPPATLVKQADRLIDARGLTLALNSTYGVMINGGVSGNDVIVSANGHQYAAYYVQSAAGQHVAVARRRAPSATSAGGVWAIADLTTATLDNGLRGDVP